jgi:xanthine/uracil permease
MEQGQLTQTLQIDVVIGTLLYILITKAKIPAYLGSSFAFITPIITGLSNNWSNKCKA